MEKMNNVEGVDNISSENISKKIYLDKVFLIAFGTSALIISFVLSSMLHGVIPILLAIAFAFTLSYSIKHTLSKSVKTSLLSIVSVIIILFFISGIVDIENYLLFYVPFLLLRLAVGMPLVILIGFGIRKLLKIKIVEINPAYSSETPIEKGRKFLKIDGNWRHYILSFVYFWTLSLIISIFLNFWYDPFTFGDFIFKYSGISRLLFNPVLIIISIVIVIVVYFSFLKGVIAGTIPLSLLFIYLMFFTSGESQGYGLLAVGSYVFYLVCLAELGVFIRIFYNTKNNVLKILFFVLPFIILSLGFIWFAQGMNSPTEFYCGTIGSSSSSCYYHLAVQSKNENFCNRLGSSDFETSCQVEVALAKGLSCMDFTTAYERILCFKKTGTYPERKDYPELCNSVSQSSCNTQWAVFLKDEYFCKISTREKQYCFTKLAIHMNDS